MWRRCLNAGRERTMWLEVTVATEGSGLRSLLQQGPAWPSRPTSCELVPSRSVTSLFPPPPKLPQPWAKACRLPKPPRECPPWPLPPPNPHVTLSFLFSRTRSMSICTRAHLLNCELPGGLGLLVHLRVTCCQDVLRKTFSHALTYVTTRAGLKDAAVHAVSRPRKDQDSLILLARGACSGDIRGDRKRNCDSRGLGRGNEEPFGGDRVSVS